jgi:ribosomal protein S18 acetylase RimI-like enzyme
VNSISRTEKEPMMKIRKAEANDLAILERLFEEFSGWRAERAVSIRKAITNPDGELLVAEVDGQVVGFLGQFFFEDPLHAGLISFITDLFVEKRQRKKGIGSELVKKALSSAKTRNVREVHITTGEKNLEATRLYQKHGFNRAGIVLEYNP